MLAILILLVSFICLLYSFVCKLLSHKINSELIIIFTCAVFFVIFVFNDECDTYKKAKNEFVKFTTTNQCPPSTEQLLSSGLGWYGGEYRVFLDVKGGGAQWILNYVYSAPFPDGPNSMAEARLKFGTPYNPVEVVMTCDKYGVPHKKYFGIKLNP